MIVALKLGVVLNRLLLVMTTPICLGLTPALLKTSRTQPKATAWEKQSAAMAIDKLVALGWVQ